MIQKLFDGMIKKFCSFSTKTKLNLTILNYCMIQINVYTYQPDNLFLKMSVPTESLSKLMRFYKRQMRDFCLFHRKSEIFINEEMPKIGYCFRRPIL